ncbi:type VI secretion system protein TssA [Candidatus Methylospira mobilis]|uniref:type VI secretion system protein TssA n=1 Tax=Candidatus Methylospira mobilis TaxID=1808979 RepID=UPI0018849D74|nr:type VI secretion system protein TssA [Candidatus Methylospira mobilis]WNV05086.1 type VI secretion system protein TssA [Candidatus Methylospira mobilis]
MTELNELSEKICAPITEAAPAGKDSRQDPLFDAMQAEIDKQSSPTTYGLPDWEKVTGYALELVGTKGKDILTLCYLCMGLYKTRGFDGLAIGLQSLATLTNSYWDTLFPPPQRIRARRNAIEWLQDEILKSIDNSNPLPEISAFAGTTLISALDSLDDILGQKDDSPPSLYQLRTLFGSFPVTPEPEPAPAQGIVPAENDSNAPSPAATAEQVNAQTANVAGSAPPPASATPQPALNVAAITPVTTFGSSDAVSHQLQLALESIQGIADWLMQQNSADEKAYRLSRIASWSAITALPPNTAGKTAIPEPDNSAMQVLEVIAQNKQAKAMLSFAEARMRDNLFWLDLQRMSAQALEQLGGEFKAAHTAVCNETGALLKRLPGLADLCFSSGKPFADSDTQSWLKTLGGGETGGNSADAQINGLLIEVKTAQAEGRLIAGMELFEQQLRALTPRLALLGRVKLYELLRNTVPDFDIQALLGPLLSELDDGILEHRDPEIAIEVLSLCYRARNKDEASEPANKLILGRIARISPAAVLRLAL